MPRGHERLHEEMGRSSQDLIFFGYATKLVRCNIQIFVNWAIHVISCNRRSFGRWIPRRPWLETKYIDKLWTQSCFSFYCKRNRFCVSKKKYCWHYSLPSPKGSLFPISGSVAWYFLFFFLFTHPQLEVDRFSRKPVYTRHWADYKLLRILRIDACAV